VHVDRETEAVLARTIRTAHVAPRVRRRERRRVDAERLDVVARFVERDGERAIDHERLIDRGERDAAERSGDLDGLRDARARCLLPLHAARIELRGAFPQRIGVRRRRYES